MLEEFIVEYRKQIIKSKILDDRKCQKHRPAVFLASSL